jgi:hypothetical protein
MTQMSNSWRYINMLLLIKYHLAMNKAIDVIWVILNDDPYTASENSWRMSVWDSPLWFFKKMILYVHILRIYILFPLI